MQTFKPRVSIVFPSYNGVEYLKKNLDSIKNLNNNDEIEVVIVDNMSIDSSINVIKSYESDINIKLIRNKFNEGFAEACNSGVKNSNGEFIFITNQDVIFPPEFFEKLANIYSTLKNKQEIVISPALIFENGKIHYFGAKNHFLGFSYTPETGEMLPKKKIIKNAHRLSGGSFYVKKDFFIRMGGFDKEFFMYYEDTDLSLKILRNGNKIYTTNDPFLIHQKPHHPLSDLQYYFLERNRFIVIIKNIRNIRKIVPMFIIVEFILIFHALLTKRFKLRVKLYLDLILKFKYFKKIRKISKNENHLLPYQAFSKTLDPLLLGDLKRLKVFKILLNQLNKFLKLF